jgi:hypothetical protein
MKSLSLALVFAILSIAARPASSGERITIGGVEEVVIVSLGISLPARVDTGSGMSSLGVRDFSVQGKMVEFSLPAKFGDLKLRLPLLGWRRIKTTEGPGKRRPVVEMELRLGSGSLYTQVTLNNRSRMRYPLLIGRNTLGKGSFIVDVSRSYTLLPELRQEELP